MVKVKPKGVPAPGTEAAKAAAKKAPAKQAGDLTREALAADPKEGDRRHDDAAGVDVVFHDGKWVPAAGQSWGGGPMTSEQAAEPDKAPAGGWGTAAEADADAGDPPPDTTTVGTSQQGQIGWGLDGQQRIVDEEGADASEAGKVKQSRTKKTTTQAPDADDQPVNLTGMSKELLSYIERAERIMEERSVLGEDLKEVIAEAKQHGYSTKIIRKVLSRRAMDPEKRKEEDALLDLYEDAINGIEKS